jgi:large subunit ribosomal protein L21
MFAVVDIAGFQEKVTEGAKLRVPLLDLEPGKVLSLDKVLLIAKDDSSITLGTPYVDGAAVEIKAIVSGQGEKIRVYKMRRRKRFRKTHGHRQDFTDVEVTKIVTSGAKKTEKAEKKAPVKKA